MDILVFPAEELEPLLNPVGYAAGITGIIVVLSGWIISAIMLRNYFRSESRSLQTLAASLSVAFLSCFWLGTASSFISKIITQHNLSWQEYVYVFQWALAPASIFWGLAALWVKPWP